MAVIAPINLVATVISSSCIGLTWKNKDDYAWIRVYRGKGDTEEDAIADLDSYVRRRGSSDSMEDKGWEFGVEVGLEAEKWYAYTIFGFQVHPYEASDPTDPATGKTLATLAAPTLVVATPISDTKIDITFKDNSLAENWHRIQRKLGEGDYGDVVDLEPNREFYRDTGRTADSLYTYKVHAMQEEGDLDNFALESAQVRTFDVPETPTLAVILDADTQDKSIRIRWTGVANETGYRIEQDTVEIAVVGADVTDFLATGLTSGIEYEFRIRAYNAAGNSGYSDVRAKTTLTDYVPIEFEKWIRNPNIEPVYLAEIYTKMDLEGFGDEVGVTWQKKIGASDRGIDILEVFEDGVVYTKEEVDEGGELTNPSTFWFDYDSRILYVRSSAGDGDPGAFLIEGAFWLYFSTHKDIEFTVASGRLHHFLPLLAKEDIPDITQEIKPYFEGSFAISSGSIAFKNGTKFFDKIFSTYTWINAKVILKVGSGALPIFTYAQFKEIFTSYIDQKSCTDAKITFQLRDVRKEMTQPIILNKFNTTTYPYIDETFVGKLIPVIFGFRGETIPVPIDMENQHFKFNDSSIAFRSGEVNKVTRVRARGRGEEELTEDTHYYVDLQRSIITFERDGRFIIDSGNNKINFKELVDDVWSAERTATLDSATYTTATLLTEIEDEMNAAVGRVHTYAASCSAAPEKRFTISAGAGEVFSLRWRTGTNGKDGTKTSVGITIGYDDDDDVDGEESYEADIDVITINKGDIIKVSFTGLVDSADETIDNGAEIFKHLMNNYKGIADSELNLDSIYATKYAKPNVLALPIESEPSFDEIVRTIEHSMEAYTFQDEFGRLGIKPQQTTEASNVKYIISKHIFDHVQSKDKGTLFWKVNVYYNKDYDDNWEVKTATKNEINWKHSITKELPLYTYFTSSSHATDLAANILNLLNKERIENGHPMLLFDVMAGDLIKFSRTRFYDSDGKAEEITLRVIRISKSPASGRTSITAEIVN